MASPPYHTGPRGYIGYNYAYTSPSGAVSNGVIPAMVLVDETGAPTGSASAPSNTTIAPNATATSGLSRQQTTVASGSLILKAAPGNLYGYNCVSGASNGYLMFFDSTTVPADGTVTPKLVQVLAANASIQTDRDIPIRFTTGIVMVFSTTGPFTKTISATAFLAGDVA